MKNLHRTLFPAPDIKSVSMDRLRCFSLFSKALSFLMLMIPGVLIAEQISDTSIQVANYAVKHYEQEMIDTLAELVKFKTVARDDLPLEQNPEFTGFKKYLASKAKSLGLDYKDYGYIVIIGLGKSSDRIGIVTHGDVQPAAEDKWRQSPYQLDSTSEPGRLIARGSEDDKGPIATALYAMKSLIDNNVKLNKRIELIIYLAEESDWDPLIEFLKTHTPPQINITIDADYPVVVAEKGYGHIQFSIPTPLSSKKQRTVISDFTGGFFGSQIPEDASATILNADQALLKKIKQRIALQSGVSYHFVWQGKNLTITAKGESAHSSEPHNGVNAIAYLADALNVKSWGNTSAGLMVDFVNEMLGTNSTGKNFGDIAYRHDFMGDLTLVPTVLKKVDGGLHLNINMRRPAGKDGAILKQEIEKALAEWQNKHQIKLHDVALLIGQPYMPEAAPQTETLLSVFSYFTGIKNPQAISIGGSTNAKILPNAVSFGPCMPGVEYTGHSEHEFITVKQFILNLKMYTAMMIELTR